MSVVRPGLAALGSLVVDDYIATPSAVRAAAQQARDQDGNPVHLVDVAYAALLAGEARRARRVLAEIGASPVGASLSRHLDALRTWAGQVDGNWYPGRVGSEVPTVDGNLDLVPSPGDPETMLVEHVVVYGPPALSTPRTNVDAFMGAGNTGAAEQMADFAIASLQNLVGYAASIGAANVALWGQLAQSDLARRSGRAALAEEWLGNARQTAITVGAPAVTALAHMMEGDWFATPGSSPEALGFDLSAQQAPSPLLATRNLERARRCYEAADAVASEIDAASAAPRFAAAVHLRWSVLAWIEGDHERRRAHLEAAMPLVASAGDAAGVHLVAVHVLIADLAEGRLSERLLELGAGWSYPTHGAVAEVRAWGELDGSISWCAGLGRLLQRVGEHWAANGDAEQAALALAGALHLVDVVPALPTRTIATAIADVDRERRLSTRALVRLERLLGDDQPSADLDPRMAFAEQVEVLAAIISAQRPRQRTAAAEHAARALERVRQRLVTLCAAAGVTADDDASGGLAAAQARLDETIRANRNRGLDDLGAVADGADQAIAQMAAMVGIMAREQITLLDVVIPLSRAEHALRLGLVVEAERWFDVALEASRVSGAPAFMTAVVLGTADRRDEARAELATLVSNGALDDDSLASLALGCDDVDTASSAFARTGRDPMAANNWSDTLTAAEIALRTGQPGDALDIALRGIDLFEGQLSRLLRDVDRLAACDDPDAAHLYLIAAKALLALADTASSTTRLEMRARSFEITERARSLSIGPLIAGREEVPAALRRPWLSAAAEWGIAMDRLLAAIDAAPPIATAPFLQALDVAEDRLRDVEIDIDRGRPGALIRRAGTVPSLQLGAVQERLPAGTVLVMYQAVGDDLIVWAVTKDSLQVEQRTVRSRRLAAAVRAYHQRCAQGSGEGPERDYLTELLLDPVGDVVSACERVVVVPFGPLNALPFHALPLRGEALGRSHVVSYAPTASVVFQHPFDHPIAPDRAVVIGDPAFDQDARPTLRPLPGARAEARVVGRLLGTHEILVREDATETAVRGALTGRDVVHLATHGWLDELAPQASSLVLAGRDELTVAELVGLQIGAELAVLSACDTGRGAATLGGDVVGLTRALLASGVRRTVVSLWPVDDATACVTMAYFYEQMMAGQPCAAALATAQRTILGLDHETLRGRYTDLTGTEPADGLGRRRGSIELDPELRDDEAVPLPLGGAAERHWAPFVLIGA